MLMTIETKFYSLFREASTGGDLDYGFEDEEVLKVEEVANEK